MRKPFIITIVASLIVPFIIGGQIPPFIELDMGPTILQPTGQTLPALASAPTVPEAIAPPYVAPKPTTVQGTSSAMQFIFQHESGNRLDAVNEIGACGIAQSLPCSKLSNVCPNWRTDGECQIRFFTNYAIGRYGSWEAAQSWWLSHSWW